LQTRNITDKDIGVGMTAEQINSIFRLGATRSCPGTVGEQGSGLGLLVCKDLLDKHGAALRIESRPGEGAAFSFEI
jgi:signal transduction histidine kinase